MPALEMVNSQEKIEHKVEVSVEPDHLLEIPNQTDDDRLFVSCEAELELAIHAED